MRSGDRYVRLQAHQLGKHFGSPHHGKAAAARFDQFGIVAPYRRRHDHDVRARDIVGRLPLEYFGAGIDEPLGDVGPAEVRTLHFVS